MGFVRAGWGAAGAASGAGGAAPKLVRGQCALTGAPYRFVGASCKLVGAPISGIGAPCNFIGASYKSVGAPIVFVGAPMRRIGAPMKFIGAPTKFVGAPTNLHDAPTNLYDAPTNLHDAPMSSVSRANEPRMARQCAVYGAPYADHRISASFPVTYSELARIAHRSLMVNRPEAELGLARKLTRRSKDQRSRVEGRIGAVRLVLAASRGAMPGVRGARATQADAEVERPGREGVES